MEPLQTKKSFASYQQMLQSTLKSLAKYSKSSRRGFILVVEDNTGLHTFGTKNLKSKFLKTQKCSECNKDESWTAAARHDTLDLNSEDTENVEETAPKVGDDRNILASVYEANETPKLPFHLDLMAEKEARSWLLPELKKDLVENGSRPVNRIIWGDPKFKPKCWADDLAEWCSISNICHPQKNKLNVPLVKVLKATIANRLRDKNLDPKQHVDTNIDKEKEKRKRMARGNPKRDEHADNSRGELIEQISEAVSIEANVENEPNDEVIVENENESEVAAASIGDIQADDDVFVPSLDESFEREDGIGRRILPMRPQPNIEDTENDVVMDVNEDDNERDDGEDDREGGEEGLSPVVSLLPSARRVGKTQDDGTWSRGRGKGGLNLRILRGRITKEVSKTEENKNKKIAWKQWVKGYTAEINEIIKNNPKGLHIICEDCEKKVSKASYLRHRTVNGCSKMNPRIRLFNWI